MKPSRKKCLADGGIVRSPADDLMDQMAKKYGLPAAGPATQTPPQNQTAKPATPATLPQQQVQPQTPPQGQGGIVNIMRNRSAVIDKASGFANGGIVEGIGTPTSDSVPVKIKGRDYNLSDTEAVLPSKTRQALGEMLGAEPGNEQQANALVEDYIAKTNGKPPVKVKHGTKLAGGGILEDETKKVSPTGMTYSDVNSATVGQATKPAPVVPLAPVARSITAPTVSTPTASAAEPTDPDISVINGIRHVNVTPETRNPFAMAADAVGGTVKYIANNAVPTPFENRAASIQAANRAELNNDTAAPAVAPSAQAQISANPPAAGTAKKPADNPLASPPGIITAENVNDRFAKNGGIDSMKSGQIFAVADVNGANAIADRANRQRGAMIDSMIAANGGNGIAALPDYADAANAEKTARWRQDDLISAINGPGSRSQKAALGNALAASIQGGNQVQVEGMRQASELGRNQVAMRGQDVTAQTEAARLAGNPNDQRLKTLQGDAAEISVANARQLQDLNAEYQKEPDPKKRAVLAEQIRTLSGKDPASKFVVVPGGEYTDPDNPLNKLKSPSQVFDTASRQFITPGGGQAAAPAAANAAPKVGEVRQGYRFNGGSPADPNAWEKM